MAPLFSVVEPATLAPPLIVPPLCMRLPAVTPPATLAPLLVTEFPTTQAHAGGTFVQLGESLR
jgi:hypothetical protein